MKPITIRIGVLLLLMGLLTVIGFRQVDSERRKAAQLQQELEQLRRENEELREQAVQQRELLREQTLKSTRRSADELLGLFPSKFPIGNWQPAEARFEDCWFHSVDGLRLHGWLLRHPRPRAILLHLHGNAGNLSHRARFAELLSERCGASVMLLDYRGYGRSEGVPTMEGLLRDARAARAYVAARESLREDQIVLVGESLGGAVAVDLAAEDGARGLVLASTFSSLQDVAKTHYPPFLVSLLVSNKLNSASRIGKYHGPLLQIHGAADATIPLAFGRKLFDAANEPKTLLILPGHDHNSALPEEFYAALDRFLRGLPDSPSQRSRSLPAEIRP